MKANEAVEPLTEEVDEEDCETDRPDFFSFSCADEDRKCKMELYYHLLSIIFSHGLFH